MIFRAVAIGLVALSVWLLESHSVVLWTELVAGKWPGWGWALLARPDQGWGFAVLPELLNLLAWGMTARVGASWLPRSGWTLLGVLTTLVVATAPLAQVSQPLLAELAAPVAIETARVQEARAAVASLERDKGAYRRAGATGHLRETETALGDARADLDALLRAAEAAAAVRALRGRTAGLLAMQAIVILLAVIAIPLGMRIAVRGRLAAGTICAEIPPGKGVVNMAEYRRSGRVTQETIRDPVRDGPNPPANSAELPEPASEAARRAVRAYAKRHGLRYQSEVAEAIGEAASTLSEFVNGKTTGERRAKIMEALRG